MNAVARIIIPLLSQVIKCMQVSVCISDCTSFVLQFVWFRTKHTESFFWIPDVIATAWQELQAHAVIVSDEVNMQHYV